MSTAGCTLNSVVSPAVTVNVSTWEASSAGPSLMTEAQAVSMAPLSSSTVTAPPAVKLGASLTAVIVNRNVTSAAVSSPLLAVPPSSDSVTVITVVPLASASTSKVRLPLLVSTAGCTLNSVVSAAATV